MRASWYSDSAHANANITFVQIYDQSTAPGGKLRFKSILAHIESRPAPVARSSAAGCCACRSSWTTRTGSTTSTSISSTTCATSRCPSRATGASSASRLRASTARALDLNRPLWEIYVIEGLDSITDLPRGSFALLTKIHHAAVEVQGHHEIIDVLHDAVALPSLDPPPEPWFAERAPGTLGAAVACRAARGVVAGTLVLADGAPAAGRGGVRARRAAAGARRGGHALQLRGLAAPRVRHAALRARRVRAASARSSTARRSTMPCSRSAPGG